MQAVAALEAKDLAARLRETQSVERYRVREPTPQRYRFELPWWTLTGPASGNCEDLLPLQIDITMLAGIRQVKWRWPRWQHRFSPQKLSSQPSSRSASTRHGSHRGWALWCSASFSPS